jgi:hypothetical protein
MNDPFAIIITAYTATVWGGVGAAIGAIGAGEKWVRLGVPGRGSIAPSLGVAPGGVRAGGHFRFR